MSKILFVEDSPEVYAQINLALGSTAEITWVKTLADAEKEIANNKFELLLLDIGLPDGNGIDFCSKVHMANPKQAIFMITAHNDLSEKVLGFTAGADDYIIKPFNSLELKARVEARLKKIQLQDKLSTVSEWDQLKVDKNKQRVSVLENGEFSNIDLTHIEFKLLTYLSDREEVVVPRDEILNEIWGKEVYVYSRSVDTHISKLRKKLGSASAYIQSVHGTGYKFSPAL